MLGRPPATDDLFRTLRGLPADQRLAAAQRGMEWASRCAIRARDTEADWIAGRWEGLRNYLWGIEDALITLAYA